MPHKSRSTLNSQIAHPGATKRRRRSRQTWSRMTLLRPTKSTRPMCQSRSPALINKEVVCRSWSRFRTSHWTSYSKLAKTVSNQLNLSSRKRTIWAKQTILERFWSHLLRILRLVLVLLRGKSSRETSWVIQSMKTVASSLIWLCRPDSHSSRRESQCPMAMIKIRAWIQRWTLQWQTRTTRLSCQRCSTNQKRVLQPKKSELKF